ncbi:hypothetical protein [Niameybacter massiliensis]|uniref:hypothetical protein n=1 Tax=Niameybacter massiliensis TaxID=1658108 RepID=UPI0012B637E7|nr:hypothetical protein [Niameybacter massiliensis]
MKSIKTRLEINVYQIEFSYNTIRGNWKKQTWEVRALSENEARAALKAYIIEYNMDYDYRPYLNAEILSVRFKETELIEI